ncbi:salicylate hydroxylase [Actinorugispora endophytica]|uniref:Salicylate hydroxylase n=1 Tax=Actinorugispora endophytica TaxID=1605990 RepID=A0A4R6UWQ3_9ACTN|nr:salicylate hydroxylase [Actinorugispora endophytica]
MRIVIVGAGIAGLTLATALSRYGIDPVVLEQAQRPALLGAGAQLPPNATRPLIRLGLGDALEDQGIRPASRDTLHWRDGSLMESMPMGEEYEARFGAPYYTVLRSDLHAALLSAVPAGSVRTGYYVTDVLDAADSITLRCADGREVHGDVVIGADGAHSAVRGALSPEAHQRSRLSVCRGLVPASAVPSLGGVPRIRVWLGPGRHFVCYPVSSGRALSFSAVLPNREVRLGSWNTPRRIDDLNRAFAGWSGEVSALVSASKWIGVWALYERAPVREWSQGRIALVGDAAHPMMPFFSQGITQSIEDAVVLAGLLHRATLQTVEESLTRYARTRRERVERVQGLAVSLLGSLREAGESEVPGRPLLAERERSEADWVYGHDVEADADVP